MTLRQLEFLVSIEELGSISACAEHMGVSQPAVTNQILQLEAELSVQLLIRNVHGARLTANGQLVAGRARKVMALTQEIPIALDKEKAALSGKIILGVSPLSPISVYHFPRIYRPFHREHPNVVIDVVEIGALGIGEHIMNGRIDLALTPLPLFTTRAQYEPIWREELVVISNPDNALDDTVTMRSLQNYGFIFMKQGYSLNLTVSRLTQEAGYEAEMVAEASNIHTLIGFVSAGMGIAVIPRESVACESHEGLVKMSRITPTALRRLAMIFRDRDGLSPVVEVFMAYVRSYATLMTQKGSQTIDPL